jgi:hypothetical protein
MTEVNELLLALSKLETLQATSRDIHPDQRKDVLGMRRLITEQQAKLFTLAANVFEQSSQREDFRLVASSYRSAIADHFGSWPIVTIDRSDATYLASLARFRECQDDFAKWIRKAVLNA